MNKILLMINVTQQILYFTKNNKQLILMSLLLILPLRKKHSTSWVYTPNTSVYTLKLSVTLNTSACTLRIWVHPTL